MSKTANDNSFYLWRHCVKKDDGIDKYLILEKNNTTLRLYNNFTKHEKKFVLWKNSYKHFKKFFDADLFFVTFSHEDVVPNKLLFKNMDMRLKKPFINLQSGISIKNIREKGHHYGNNILRFFTYSQENIQKLEDNYFTDYQIYYTPYQPKYNELFEVQNDENQILWFIDNRRYFNADPLHIKSFATIIKRIIEDEQLIKYLKSNNFRIKICTHAFIEDNVFNEFKKFENKMIQFVKQAEINMQHEIAKSKLFITDYSHYIFDASIIDKPYILFQPDRNNFSREKLIFDEHLKDFIIKKPKDLINIIINEKYQINEYIEKCTSSELDVEFIEKNKHLEQLYNYFRQLQLNKITFIGYNFYGIGGTVNATMALAESLLYKGYWVEIIGLKRLTELKHTPPYGLNMQYITWDGSGSIVEKINRKRYKSPKYYHHLEVDYVKKFLPPYAGYKLDDLMKNIKTNTLISTRETLHLFLNDCVSPYVKNKMYFFHTPADMIDNLFPNLMGRLNNINVDKAIFITEQNKIGLEKNYGYKNYHKSINLGNTLIKSKIIEKDEIKPITKKDKYNAIYLLRISKARKDDLNNLIEFAKYIKDNNIDLIDIDVFGDGDYVKEFIKLIKTNNLSDIIHYKSATENPIEEIRNHDFMIDFSLNHSFGMIYIEAVFNGKKVFCMENLGSREVMGNIPNSFIQSPEWLINQIKNIADISVDELKDNYDKISEKYSQTAIADKFIQFMNEE